MNKTIVKSLTIAFVVMYILVSCAKRDSDKGQQSKENMTDVRPGLVRRQNTSPRYIFQEELQDEDTATKEITIDSVPSGASVFLVPEDYREGNLDLKKPLGMTPLTLKQSRCPSMIFWVAMDINQYLKHVNSIPEMKTWVSDLQDSFFGEADTDMHDFNFGYSGILKVTDPNTRLLEAIGPICEMKWPDEKRLCVLFIPRTVSCTVFYPLMPKPGTFALPDSDWRGFLRRKYRFSEQQLDEAAECLTRCGGYFTRVEDPANAEKAIDYSITLQDTRNKHLISKRWPVDRNSLF